MIEASNGGEYLHRRGLITVDVVAMANEIVQSLVDIIMEQGEGVQANERREN